jgi:dTMP kinase
MKTKRFYGKGLPGVDPSNLKGTLIVIEGSDGSGRSTQSSYLMNWLERKGYPTVQVGLKRSELVGEALAEAMRGNTLNAITLNLFYATDFADQLERVIIPALKAGFVVLADRYIYTMMARDIVRGSSMDWLREIYGFALVPDAVFYLNVSPKILAERHFSKSGMLDYWESGMDIQRVGGMYDNFIKYPWQGIWVLYHPGKPVSRLGRQGNKRQGRENPGRQSGRPDTFGSKGNNAYQRPSGNSR